MKYIVTAYVLNLIDRQIVKSEWECPTESAASEQMETIGTRGFVSKSKDVTRYCTPASVLMIEVKKVK